MKILSKEVSVVFQGAINQKYIENGVDSVRKYLPESEIIILHGRDNYYHLLVLIK